MIRRFFLIEEAVADLRRSFEAEKRRLVADLNAKHELEKEALCAEIKGKQWVSDIDFTVSNAIFHIIIIF